MKLPSNAVVYELSHTTIPAVNIRHFMYV